MQKRFKIYYIIGTKSYNSKYISRFGSHTELMNILHFSQCYMLPYKIKERRYIDRWKRKYLFYCLWYFKEIYNIDWYWYMIKLVLYKKNYEWIFTWVWHVVIYVFQQPGGLETSVIVDVSLESEIRKTGW